MLVLSNGGQKPLPERNPQYEFGSISSCASSLRKCCREKALMEGKRIHEYIMQQEYDGGNLLGSLLIQMYGKCGQVHDAFAAFKNIRERDVSSYNVMIAAYAENGHLAEAKNLFDHMSHQDVVSWNAMVSAYARNGDLTSARNMFDNMGERNVVSWNALISSYAQNGHLTKSFEMFWLMCLEGTKPNEITFVSILEACDLVRGRIVHGLIIESGLYTIVKVANAVISMYGKVGSLHDVGAQFDRMPSRNVVSWTVMVSAYGNSGELDKARNIFNETPNKNVVSWNAMIEACSQNGDAKQALEIFSMMDVNPNISTFISTLNACNNVEDGKKIHSRITSTGLQSNVRLATALLNMYGSCGSLENSKLVFDQIQRKDMISWNCMIMVYGNNGHGKEAINLYKMMNCEGLSPNVSTCIAVLEACSMSSNIQEGKLIYKRAIDTGLSFDVKITNAVMNMYGKCGCIQDARSLFDKTTNLDVVSWNIMIAAYANNGNSEAALHTYWLMCLEGFEPDDITFICVLSACSHGGLIDRGRNYFLSIVEEWQWCPTPEHYICTVDLLGRAGQLLEAENLITSMPFEPAPVAWRAVLGGCRININVECGRHAAKQLVTLDPLLSTPYIFIANTYASLCENYKKLI